MTLVYRVLQFYNSETKFVYSGIELYSQLFAVLLNIFVMCNSGGDPELKSGQIYRALSAFSVYSHLSNLLSRVLLQLVEEVTLLMLLLRRVFNESPRLKTPFAVMEKDRSL